MAAGTEDVIAALEALCEAVRENQEREDVILRRAAALLDDLRTRPLCDAVEAEERPLIVELVGQALDALSAASSRFRRTEALALVEAGLSTARVAELFGVSRQRVSTLLAEARGAMPRGAPGSDPSAPPA